MNKSYFIYIITNTRNTVLYTGVTNDLKRRIFEHKEKTVDGFSKKYNLEKLVYFEETNDINTAIAREKQLKKWKRSWKVDLIEKDNSDWIDLYSRLD